VAAARPYYLGLRVNAEQGEGIDLAHRFHIFGYPTMVVVNRNGEEIDRIIGYLPPKEMAAELDRIRLDRNTVADYQRRLKETPNDLSLWRALALKYDDRRDLNSALEVWETIVELTDSAAEDSLYLEADYQISYIKSRLSDSLAELESYLARHPDGPYTAEAYNTLLREYRMRQDVSGELNTYSRYLAYVERLGKADPSLLNRYAWRMAELEQNLTDALEKARLAVALIPEDDSRTRAMIKDTEAEVLWKLGRTEEAVQVIEECIALQPEDEYYQNQKAKFLGDTRQP
jgi:tetratricopeptide (TPR) repeat protein